MSNQSYIIFVYGTLLPGHRNSHVLKDYLPLCLKASTKDLGEMLMFFDRPYVHFEKELYSIKGALYEVTEETLATLDELEKHPEWYRRVEKSIYSDTHKKDISAKVYEINNVPEVPFCKSNPIGCYRQYMQDYDGELAQSYTVENGKLVKLTY